MTIKFYNKAELGKTNRLHEAPDLTNISMPSIKRAISIGELTAYKISPRRTVLKTDELLTWAEQWNKKTSTRWPKNTSSKPRV